ncbi:MAG: helix-hairpin-helix domain-containing protein [Rubrivivax sp.]|nr:helix-hairpin-helix domain-containing protein [Rubrivivax sp.]MDH5338516.1 helix-hairpin-helix domain-containing protein [Rubrivivax sp.]
MADNPASAPAAPRPSSKAPASAAHDNAAFADMLREMAGLLESQGDNAWRVAAYRKAADMIAALPRSMREVFQREGLAGLEALPTIGPGIAAAIGEIVQSGRWSRLDRLRGTADASTVFRTLPGVGPRLAQRLHDELEVDSLEALEAAAHDGRLERMPRVGARRAAAIRASLTQMLDRARALRRARSAAPATGSEPAVEVLLDIDRAYRTGAASGKLPTIAPRRFNPQGRAWLPILHSRRGDWHFTALYSNTARAHELGRVHDWVVIYAEDPDHHERQYTAVTATAGPLAGRRVVRGREAQCRDWYASRDDAARAD